MKQNEIKRRQFLRMAGLTAAGASLLGSRHVIGRTTRGYLLESESEYGGFVVEQLSGDDYPYETDPLRLKRMNEKYTIFSRNVWDPTRQDRPEKTENLTYKRLVEDKGTVPDNTRLDYAFMAASWATSSFRGSPFYSWHPVTGQVRMMTADRLGKWDPSSLEMNWEDATVAVKHAALFYGGSLAGVAKLNPLWLYDPIYSPTRDDRENTKPFITDGDKLDQGDDKWQITPSMNRVIVIAFEEDYEAIMNSPGKLASAATGDGYSRMAVTAFKLSEFIRALGYNAVPAGNGVGLSIPMAIDAGLGELGRNGLLVTPKFGPRVRIAKVLTDMPLVPDKPISFGVKEFCEACLTCANDCPSGSIGKGPMTWEGLTTSNNPGALKWYVNQETCYDYNGFSCSNCKRNCPFNKPNNSWLHKAIREIIKLRSKGLGNVMVNLDQASGYGEQVHSDNFWESDGSRSITAREKM
ncbi:MAG: reductive dehalogenase [Bacteroidales bacterium]|nr:reductive dehalogenase [Bacteroidales bacterium]